MQLVLQPCGDSDAREHFVDTIENRVPVTQLLPFLTDAEQQIVASSFEDRVAVWGVTPAANQSNAKAWHRMNIGDTALLYRNGRFFFRGTIAFKTHNEKLAAELWDRRDDGVTWEYVFFLTDLEPIDIDIATFRQAAGYAPRFIVQRFQVLHEELSDRILEQLDLPEAAGPRAVSIEDIDRARRSLAALTGDLDRDGAATRRQEQSLLRTIVFGTSRSKECSICGRELPVDLLAVGHIKKRSSCNAVEKRDEANVMPVCYLGCDRLFENGYIFVDTTGLIRRPRNQDTPQDLKAALDFIVGRGCSAWSERSSVYFDWHRSHLTRIA